MGLGLLWQGLLMARRPPSADRHRRISVLTHHLRPQPPPPPRASFAAAVAADGDRARPGPVVISTWDFGQPANDIAMAALQGGAASALDAVEAGVRSVEAAGNSSVGPSGLPNAAGVRQLDACVMNGPDHEIGSVAGVEGVLHPVTAARCVMERTPHAMLVGQGAKWFAEAQGLETYPTEEDEEKYEQWLAEQVRTGEARMPSAEDKGGFGGPENHDTVALLVLDADGNLAGGCSTSGWGGKLPGRVGDSPIIGSGLYVDNEVGAAGATGLGENVMRYCVSYQVRTRLASPPLGLLVMNVQDQESEDRPVCAHQIVENMRQGMTPTEACVAALRRCVDADKGEQPLDMNFVALDKSGRFGAAGTGQFPFSVAAEGVSEVREAEALTGRVMKTGGNVR